jgi:N-acetylgalactosamine PTS system EIIA component
MSERARARAIIAGHGDVAAGLVSAVQQIAGRGADFVAISNRGLGADDIERTLREAIASTGARVLFTDLPGGSCTIAARRVLRTRPDLVLVTGANVAALLDFVFHDEHAVADEDAAGHAVDKGRAAMLVVVAPSSPGSRSADAR